MTAHTQLLPTAKRGLADKESSKAWLSYYAGYSQSFVSSSFAALGITDEDVILDPWSGSGTTGLVAQTKGFQAISVEINPVIAYLAAGHFALNSLPIKRIEKVIALLQNIVQRLQESDEDTVTGDFILDCICTHLPSVRNTTRHRIAVQKTLLPDFSLAISIVLLAYKRVAGYKLTKNPSWSVHDESTLRKDDFCKSLHLQIAVVEASFTEPRARPTAKQIVGDARHLSLESGSINAVITSPPYLTRIDYVKATSAETAWLFGIAQVRLSRENNMGAPVIRTKTATTRWPAKSLVADVVAEVASHTSYAAQNYYLKTIRQYFDDMFLSLSELHRVLKPGGIALLVVQNSYFKEVEIPLGELYVDVWNRCFGSGEIVTRHLSNNSIVQINRRAVSSRMQKHLHEDTIALYK